jgi:hypothetical protein
MFLLIALAPRATYGQQTPSKWSAPQLLGDGWWESIAIDREARVHVGWYGSVTGPDKKDYDSLNYTAREPGGDWTPPSNVIITGVGGYTVRNSLAISSKGMLYAAYRSGIGHAFSSAPARAATMANNWTKPATISPLGYYMSMIIDRHDVLHVVYSGESGVPRTDNSLESIEASPCALCYDLFYRRSADGGKTWGQVKPISLDKNVGKDRINIFEGASGRLYITWELGLDWYHGRGHAQDVRIVYSDDGGDTWSKPMILDGGGYPDRKPIQLSVTEINNGSLMAVWRYDVDLDRNIYFQLFDNVEKKWTAPQPVPGIVARGINETPLDSYDLITDQVGSVHLFAVAQPDAATKTTPGLYQLEYRQGIWLSSRRVLYSPEMCPEWPRAVVGPENDLHLTWFIRGLKDNSGCPPKDATGILKVYYSHFPGNIPSAAVPTFIPTDTPTPTATVFQKLEATNTPFPTIAPLKTDFYIPTRDIYAIQTVLGGLLASAFLCVGVFVGYRFISRR